MNGFARTLVCFAVMAVTMSGATAPTPPQVKGRTLALVGGTLIDGFGGVPIQNSVILVDNERITAVGHARSSDAQWSLGLHALGQDLLAAAGKRDHARVRESVAARGRDVCA